MPGLWRPEKPSISHDGFKIPKQLHFLWGFLGDDGPLLGREQANFDRWKKLNPDWDLTVQNPASTESVLGGHPQAEVYRGLQTAIQRCDIARPLLLEKHGGIYSDLDVEPFRDLNWLCGLFPHASVLLVEEVTLTKASSIRRGKRFQIRNGNPELRLRVGNFWMASVPGHPFWRDVIEMIQERMHLQVQDDYDVIYTTGPDIISEVYHRVSEKYDDVVLVPRKTARRFFRHRTHGSWRVETTGQRWSA